MSMNDREEVTKAMDLVVEEYNAASYDGSRLFDMRRDLAVLTYRLTAHVKDVFGHALMTNLTRKRRIAEHVLNARSQDGKIPMNYLQEQSLTLPTVVDAQTREIWADAERDALKMKIDASKLVLMAMAQELSDLSHEKRTTSYQGT
jgi:hypothetical protein